MSSIHWDSVTTDSTFDWPLFLNQFSTAATTTATTFSNWQTPMSYQTPYTNPYNMPPVDPSIFRQLPPLEFNKYINASDLMEEFIKWVGSEGVRRREVMTLSIELFIKWLIIRACEQDQEEPNVTLQLPAPKQQPRCLGCGKWIKAQEIVHLHDARCADYYYVRKGNHAKL